jgi:hypothetical protein
LKSEFWKENIHLEHENHDQILSTKEGKIINQEFRHSQFLNKSEEHSSFDRQLDKSLIVILCRRIRSKGIVERQLNLYKDVEVFIRNDEQIFSLTKFLNNNRTMNQYILERRMRFRTTKEEKENINFDPRIKLKRPLWKEKIYPTYEVNVRTLSTEEGEIINLEFSYSQFLNKSEEHSSFDRQLHKRRIVFLYRPIESKGIVEGQLNLFKEDKVFIRNDEQTFSPTRFSNSNKAVNRVITIDECLIYHLKFLMYQFALFVINSFRCRKFGEVVFIEGFHSVKNKMFLRTAVDALMFPHTEVSRRTAAEQLDSSLMKVIIYCCSNPFPLRTPTLDPGVLGNLVPIGNSQ